MPADRLIPVGTLGIVKDLDASCRCGRPDHAIGIDLIMTDGNFAQAVIHTDHLALVDQEHIDKPWAVRSINSCDGKAAEGVH